MSFFSILLVAGGCLSDLLHDGVNLGDAPWVDGSALLLTSHAADVGSNVVKDGGESDVDNVSLAEGGGNGELILLKFEKNEESDKNTCFLKTSFAICQIYFADWVIISPLPHLCTLNVFLVRRPCPGASSSRNSISFDLEESPTILKRIHHQL